MSEVMDIDTFMDRVEENHVDKADALLQGIEYHTDTDTEGPAVRHVVTLDLLQPQHFGGVKTLPELADDIKKGVLQAYDDL